MLFQVRVVPLKKRYGTKLYDNLLEHSINSDIIFGLHNLHCFTKKVCRSYDTKLTAKDLILSPNDPKQLAMLLVCVLYLNHSYTDTVIMNQNQQNAYALHQQIIGDLGLQSDEIVYSITLFWNNELLKNGIVIYDLGDLWCEENNTQTDFDVYQSIIYLTCWTISADSLFSVISKIDSSSVYNNNSSKLTVALVVEDLLPSDIDNTVQRTKTLLRNVTFKQR